MAEAGWQAVLSRLGGTDLRAVVVRGVTGTAAVHVIAALIALAAQLILARALGAQSFGYFIVAWTWAMLLAVPSRLGFHNSLIRWTASYRAGDELAKLGGVVRVAFGTVLAAGTLFSILLVAGSFLLRGRMAGDQLESVWLAAVALPALALLGVSQAILKGFRRPALGQFTLRGLTYTLIVLLAGTAWVATGISNAPSAMLLCAVSAWLAVIISGLWVLLAAGSDVFREVPSYFTGYWIRNSLPLLLMASMSIVIGQTDTVMLGAIVGSEDGGIYAVANRLAQFSALGLVASQAIVAPLVAEYHRRDDFATLRKLLAMVAWGITLVTVAAVVLFAVLGPMLLGLFGSSFLGGYQSLMILVAAQGLNAICGPVGVVLTMTGNQGAAATVLTGAALLNVALNALMIPLWGMEGAAVASLITVGAWNGALVILALRRLGLNTSVFQTPANIFSRFE